MKNLVSWIIGGSILLFAIIIGISYMNTQGKWNRLNNACNAVFEREQVAHDEMWKTIKAQYGLKDELKEITLSVVDSYVARGQAYQNSQWTWIQEEYPQLNQTGSADFYRQLANTISDQNGKFTSIRNDVITVTNEYNNYVTNPWNQFFLFGDQETPKSSKVITSTVTQNAAKTLTDDQEWLNK
jgi:hypothetical protein